MVITPRTATSHASQQCSRTHQNGTPLRYPRNNGGSPIGVKHPPTLLTTKMKKTTWNAVIRYLFIRIQGRMSSIEAPVVPRKFDSTAPINRNRQLTHGLASPLTRM